MIEYFKIMWRQGTCSHDDLAEWFHPNSPQGVLYCAHCDKILSIIYRKPEAHHTIGNMDPGTTDIE